MAAHVLAEREEFAGRSEERGGVQAAGLVEGDLLPGELGGELKQDFGRKANGGSDRRKLPVD